VAAVGWLVQFLLERWRVRSLRQLKKYEDEPKAEEKEKKDSGKRSSSSKKSSGTSWWGWGLNQDYRRAG
jgi:hypothetical protein